MPTHTPTRQLFGRAQNTHAQGSMVGAHGLLARQSVSLAASQACSLTPTPLNPRPSPRVVTGEASVADAPRRPAP